MPSLVGSEMCIRDRLCSEAKNCKECQAQRNCIWRKGICSLVDINNNNNSTAAGGGDLQKGMGAGDKCLPPCHERVNCGDCLVGKKSPGDSSHANDCQWADRLKQCLSPLAVPLFCSGGLCGKIYSDACPVPCEEYSTCKTCLTADRATCGWCALEGAAASGGKRGRIIYRYICVSRLAIYVQKLLLPWN